MELVRLIELMGLMNLIIRLVETNCIDQQKQLPS